jgi:hypothetical protein
MGAAHRCAVEGFARSIPAAPNVPQTIPAMEEGSFFRRIIEVLAADLQERSGIDLREAFIGWTKRGKGSRIMAITDASGLPVAACLACASPHEVTLAETALDSLFIAGKPEKLIGDKAYDSASSMMIF